MSRNARGQNNHASAFVSTCILIVDTVIKVIADRYFSILTIRRAQGTIQTHMQHTEKYKSKDNIDMYIYKISLIVDIVIKVIADNTPINS